VKIFVFVVCSLSPEKWKTYNTATAIINTAFKAIDKFFIVI
jgi:hypothetical protein